MVKPITFIELVRAVYEVAPKKIAPRFVQRLLSKGVVRFEHPAQVKRLVPQH